jgi:hypothetical protein
MGQKPDRVTAMTAFPAACANAGTFLRFIETFKHCSISQHHKNPIRHPRGEECAFHSLRTGTSMTEETLYCNFYL